MQTFKNALVVIGIMLCIIGTGLVTGSVLELLSTEDAVNIFIKFVLLGVIAALFTFLVTLLRSAGQK